MWNTKIIDFLRSELHGNDSMFKETPYYRGDVNLRKANLTFHLTEQERETMETILDPFEFVKHLGMISPIISHKIGKLELYDYQKEFISTVTQSRFVTVLKSRQMGFTMLAAFLATYYTTTNHDKNFMFVTVNNDGAAEFIDKVKALYASMPFFMKPGVVSWNAKSIEFDNGCRIIAKGGTSEMAIGTKIHFTYIDEAAFIKDAAKVYRAITPFITGDSRLVIVSSPNGLNWFYDNFSRAERGENEFKALRYKWNQVPGRDEAWKNQEIRNVGQDRFDIENDHKWTLPNTVGIKITIDDVDQMFEMPTKEWLLGEIKRIEDNLKKLKDIVNGRK